MNRWLYPLVPTVCALSVCLFSPGRVAAQPAEAEQNTQRATLENADDDITLNLTAGGSLAYGNARTFTLNAGGDFQLRRAQHGFRLRLGYVYGLAASRVDPDGEPTPDYSFGPWDENANNLTGLVRYDFFLTPMDAIFAAAVFRQDPFANLQPRVGGQAGYLRNLFKEENHRFWIELGVDGTYDRFGEAFDIGGGVTSEDRFIFSARGFVGYNNQLNAVLTYQTGLEILWELARAPGSAELAHLRFEWQNQLRTKIEDWLQVALDVTARLDSQPPGQVDPWSEQANQPTQMLDLLVTLNLVGNFDLDGTPEEAEEEEEACPVCNCPEPEPCPEPAADGGEVDAPAPEPVEAAVEAEEETVEETAPEPVEAPAEAEAAE